MRKQIAAANWKMNLTVEEGETLLDNIMSKDLGGSPNRISVFAVPAPYLQMAASKIAGKENVFIAAQNVYSKKAGAFTGENSVTMLKSLSINWCIIGHSERRENFYETNSFLADKVTLCLDAGITPLFCCGEALPVREKGEQNDFVSTQLEESLFELSANDIQKVVIAYEPIWAIGTGKTATSGQAQEMHQHIRLQLAKKYGDEVAQNISILYGGSVKGTNAKEIFGKMDVDGGLVGGSSLIAEEFVAIIQSLK